MPTGVQAQDFPWDFMRRGILGFAQLLVFGTLLGLLIALGYGLRDYSEFLTIMWPASGLLLVALWSSPTRSWIWILMTQLLVQIAIYVAYAGPTNWQWGAVFAVANSVDAIVGAVVVRRLITAPSMRQIRQVLQLLAAIGLGAAVSAILGAYASIHTSAGTHFFRQWQLWWANSWLGSLFLAPVLLTWVLRRPAPGDSSPPAAIRETVLIGCALPGFACWLFASPPAALSPILHPPVLLLALVIVAAFRLPPRWATSFTALSVLIGAYFASRGLGPFAGDPDPFARIGALQLYLSTLIVINFMLTVSLVEMRDTVALLRGHEAELVKLNNELRIKQDRVQMYARQLAGAEERARRSTAVDLHDGIGQQLVGLALTLDAAGARAPPETRLLLGEASHTLRQVHASTQRVIADLSPPGLYELGLEPALQWLAVYMRGRDNLQVILHVNVDDKAFDLEMRILIFKLIRELLRNVVKHARVNTATVNVSMTPRQLSLEVIDDGVGFEWQLSLFNTPREGFGLWSVAERIREADGEMTVDTAPGRGCRVSVVFGLEARGSSAPAFQRGAG
jgi:signal transduction histidine kinase